MRGYGNRWHFGFILPWGNPEAGDRASKETFDDSVNIGLQIAQEAQKRGLIARPLGNILILSPTLIMDEAMIANVETILRESIQSVRSRL